MEAENEGVGIGIHPPPELQCNVPPVVKIENYVSAYGFSVPATFDFSGVPPKYHMLFLRIIQLGSYHLAQPAGPGKSEPPTRVSWWRKLFGKNT